MIVEIPDSVAEQHGLSERDILLRVAIALFREEKITLGQASELAGLHQIQFQRELSARNIPIHYGEEEFEQDLRTLSLKK
jgi:predicted HTH domain antitoxin